jgi:hypothetical protein
MTNVTRQILEDLEAVRENLLSLSDDIWLSIDHNDSKALEEGVQFKRGYNEKMTAFDALASELSAMIQQFTGTKLDAGEQVGMDDREDNERIIQQLNRDEPHSIDENFTFKRPYGFILDGQGTTGITTWRRLYEIFCQQLYRRATDRFRTLPDNEDFVSRRGNRAFSRNAHDLRYGAEIADGIYAEVNLSANNIRDNMRRLLATFEIPEHSLKLFLREDRDASE